MELSLEQKNIIKHLEGAALVEAAPGSGKIHVLIERIAQLLPQSCFGKVMILTVSNIVAEKAKKCVADRFKDIELYERVKVCSIQSFAFELVKTRGNMIGISLDAAVYETECDRLNLLKSAYVENPELRGHLLRLKEDTDIYLQKVLYMISNQKKNCILPEDCNADYPFSLAYADYNCRLYEQNAMDADDVILYAYRILLENYGVVLLYHNIYNYICVLEAQDLNYAQYQLIKELCGNDFNNIMMVEDVDQVNNGFIYQDRKKAIKCFVNDFSPVIYKMMENYNTAKRIVSYANYLSQHVKNPNDSVYEGELNALKLENEESEAKFVANKIELLVRFGHPDVEGEVVPERIAVIGRNRYVLSKIEEELEKQKIPYTFIRSPDADICESNYMKVFDLCIRLLINGMDCIHAIQLQKMLGISACKDNTDLIIEKENLYSLLEQSKYNLIYPALKMMPDQKETLDFNEILKELEEIIPTLEDDERYYFEQDMSQWNIYWEKYCANVAPEKKTLRSFRSQITMERTHRSNRNKGVTLLTAHMSKVLNYDVVFIMGLCEGVFPDYRAIQEGEQLLRQERIRMYTAVSRAKRLCYLTCPEKRKMPWGPEIRQEPSRYIRGVLQN